MRLSRYQRRNDAETATTGRITPAKLCSDFNGSSPPHHNDPFERRIIAQAQLEGMVLGTQDPAMQPYGVATLGLD